MSENTHPALNVATAVARALHDIGDPAASAKVQDLPPHQAIAFTIFTNARSLFGAATTLIDGQFGVPALVLLRPLFEDVAWLADYVDADDTLRQRLAMTRVADEIQEAIYLYREAERLGVSTTTTEQDLADYRASAVAALSKRGLQKTSKFNPGKSIQSRFGDPALVAYKFTHHAVHSSELVLAQHRSNDGGVLRIGVQDDDRELQAADMLELGATLLGIGAALVGEPLSAAALALKDNASSFELDVEGG